MLPLPIHPACTLSCLLSELNHLYADIDAGAKIPTLQHSERTPNGNSRYCESWQLTTLYACMACHSVLCCERVHLNVQSVYQTTHCLRIWVPVLWQTGGWPFAPQPIRSHNRNHELSGITYNVGVRFCAIIMWLYDTLLSVYFHEATISVDMKGHRFASVNYTKMLFLVRSSYFSRFLYKFSDDTSTAVKTQETRHVEQHCIRLRYGYFKCELTCLRVNA